MTGVAGVDLIASVDTHLDTHTAAICDARAGPQRSCRWPPRPQREPGWLPGSRTTTPSGGTRPPVPGSVKVVPPRALHLDSACAPAFL